MDDMRFQVLFNSISVISGRWKVDNERLCEMELYGLERNLASISRPAPNPLCYRSSYVLSVVYKK